MTKLEAPERIWAEWSGGEIEGVEAFGYLEEQAFTTEYIRADLHQRALEAARAEGRKAGLEEAAKYHINFLMTQTNASVEKIVASTEAIRSLIDTPAVPVAEAARVTPERLTSALNTIRPLATASENIILANEIYRVLAQKEGE